MSNSYRFSSVPKPTAVTLRRAGMTVSLIVQTALAALAFGFAGAIVLGLVG